MIKNWQVGDGSAAPARAVLAQAGAAGVLMFALVSCSPLGSGDPAPEAAPPPSVTGEDKAHSATALFTVNDERFSFEDVTCEGDPDSEFLLRGRSGEVWLNLGVSPDLAQLDISGSDPEEVNWSSWSDPVISFHGKKLSLTAEMIDGSGPNPDLTRSPGTLEAECP